MLTAFFLEATFLGVMLFGRDRVPAWMHTLSSFLVAIGTSASAFWILALNSWMQTPQGFEVIDGQLHATSWMAVIFNPSFPYRLAHMMIASGLTAAFLVVGISAFQLLHNRKFEPAARMLRLGVIVAAVLTPLQIVVGDMHGLNTLEHQPAKIAAIEAIWETERGAPLLLFALPNRQTRSNDYAISLPGVASLILTHKFDGELKGLAYSLFPYLVVDRMTIWQAAAARESLMFVFVGTCVVLPMIIGYTVFAYSVFWGKARSLTYGE